eukprot:GHRR01006202.1.p1 GENE.GHRR01006202.1~~GHRR01006202.1.p1  ORF type:complete len:385 (+),score=134.56 GHRR01006202.1:577-1731(+)
MRHCKDCIDQHTNEAPYQPHHAMTVIESIGTQESGSALLLRLLRFKGMQASFASNSSTTTQLAQSVGMISSSVLVPEHDLSAAPSTGVAPAVGSMFDDIGLPASILSIGKASRAVPGRQQADSSYLAALPDPTEAARRILQELGLQDAHAGLDVMMVHLDSNCSNEQQLQQLPQQEYKQQAGQQVSSSSSPIQSSLQRSTIAAPKTQEAARANAVAVLSWLDRTLRYLNNSSAFKDTMLLTVLATPGSTKLPAACPMLQSGGGDDLESRQVLEPSAVANSSSVGQLSAINALESVISEGALTQHSRQVKKPLQSWQQLGGSPLNIDPCRPLLCLRRLPGVIRRDSCTKFSLQDCCYNSGQLGLVVDRLLPEIAYKLGRALKYGA